jgi:hypothetical protein
MTARHPIFRGLPGASSGYRCLSVTTVDTQILLDYARECAAATRHWTAERIAETLGKSDFEIGYTYLADANDGVIFTDGQRAAFGAEFRAELNGFQMASGPLTAARGGSIRPPAKVPSYAA